MNTLTLGVRNAFRNLVRSSSIILILGISIGLTLTMLIAHQAVGKKITDVKASVGNSITVSPAGYNPGSDANNALTTSDLSKVTSLAHVTNVVEELSSRLSTEGTTSGFGGFGGQSSSDSNATTSLKSSVNLNSINKSGNSPRIMINGGGSLPTNFSLPISMLGTTDPSKVSGSSITIKSGKTIDGSKDADTALVSTSMASKNSLKVGSTFTAYGATITIAGIFDSGTQGGNDTVVMSLPSVQRLSGNSGEVSSATVTVDSLDNLSGVTTAVKNALGSNADVESSQDQANQTVQPLENIQRISLVSLVGAIIAGAVIILLTMVMIVRERRREIGVLKAIGGSNSRVIFQFMSEAVTLTLAGAIIGILIGIVASNPITNMLVSSSSSSNSITDQSKIAGVVGQGFSRKQSEVIGGGFQKPTGGFLSRNAGSLHNSITNIHANVGWSILAYGFGAAIIIAVIGSSLAGWLIARVKPYEVMRAE